MKITIETDNRAQSREDVFRLGGRVHPPTPGKSLREEIRLMEECLTRAVEKYLKDVTSSLEVIGQDLREKMERVEKDTKCSCETTDCKPKL